MKFLGNTGLTKLIQLIKSTFIKIEDTVEVQELDTETVSTITLAPIATTGSYTDLIDKPNPIVVDQVYNATSTNAQSGTAIAGVLGDIETLLQGV